MKKMRILLKEISAGMYLSVVISFMFCVFAPLELYFNNSQEFWFDVYRLLPTVLIMFVANTLILDILYGYLRWMNKKAYQGGLIVGTILFISSYIQGNFLVTNLPPLDGTDVDWNLYAGERMKSVIVWLIVIVVVSSLIRIIKMEKFCSCIKIISICMVLMFSVTLVSVCITTEGYREKLDASVTTKNMFEMSDDTNFIILLLDALDSETFEEVLENNPEYKEIFSDFTYYPNTMGAYSYTSRSIPFILSGEWFENDESFEKYNENVYRNSEFFSRLESNGYKLGVYESSMPNSDESIYRFENVLKCDISIKSYWDFVKLEWQLVGFKYAPFDLKKSCFFNMDDFNKIQDKKVEYPIFYFWNSNKSFYQWIAEEEITHVKEKCFKFIHLEGAHVPFRYDKDVNIIEEGTYEENIEASMTITEAYLQKLKDSGVYENSVIIVMSDHGYSWFSGYSYGRQNPMFLVKGINEKHEMSISEAPISYEDLQEAYARLMAGKDSSGIFDWNEGDQRERRYLWFQYLKEDNMIEYMQTGEACDPDTMYKTGREFKR